MPSIAISGFKRSGKDQVFEALRRAAGFTRVSMADPIYDEVSRAFGVTYEFLHDAQFKDVPRPEMALRYCEDPDFVGLIRSIEGAKFEENAARSPRFILQRWGTEYRRGQSPDYWTRMARQKVHQALLEKPDIRMACTDVRFENESEIWLNLPTKNEHQHWLIVRPLADMDLSLLNHPSEQLWRVKPADQWNHILINDGTLDDLYGEVLIALDRYWPEWTLTPQDRSLLMQAQRRWQPEIYERVGGDIQPGDRLLKVDNQGRAHTLSAPQAPLDNPLENDSPSRTADFSLLVRGADAQCTVLDLQRRRLPAQEEAALRAYGLSTQDIRFVSLYGIESALALSDGQCPTHMIDTVNRLRQGVGMSPDAEKCSLESEPHPV